MEENATNTYEGVIMVRGKNVGFVSLPDQEDDVFIPTDSLGFALDGDLVRIEITKRPADRQPEGRVLEVLEKSRDEIIGVVKKKNDAFYLLPDNRRLHIRPQLPNATKTHEGMKVAASITEWEKPASDPLADIIEVLGPAGDHETEMQAIMRSGGFAHDFPQKVQERAEELHGNSEALFAKALSDPERRDMRSIPTCTIDPSDAKDFDDALSVEKLDNGHVSVGIHIADVSFYVAEGDAIDLEARERGTSIYLVDRVIPMLPEVLSNDLCSLRPDEDRLAFSAVFEMDKDGTIHDQWFGQTVIHSDKRFSYEEAQTVLDTNEGPLLEELSTLMQIGRKLRKERYKNGAIAFEQREVEFELDEAGVPIRVYTKERTETMLMIEDFMLLANRRVAEYVHNLCKESGHREAFIYRTHDVPDPEKIEDLATFLHALGYEFKTHKGIVKAEDINKLLEKVEGSPEENLIKTATIRSMAKAVYTTKNIGHFGLAFKFYTHFTSPIRRYPDLMAHRMLRKHLDGSRVSGKELARYEKLSVQSSEREMSAVEAERNSIKYKQVEFMEDKVGEEFTAIITGVTGWGIYVEEKESKAEGMVRLSNMKSDFFEHDPKKYRVKGSKTGATYELGQEVRVKLTKADVEERQLDFALV